MPVIRSISGLRATLNDGLDEELIYKYTYAFSKILHPGAIVIGRDGRPSGLWIENIVRKTLQEAGREVHLLGVVPTPTVQLMVEHSDATGGIIITASHNPSEWNGLKFIDDSGVFLNSEWNRILWDEVDSIKTINSIKVEDKSDIIYGNAIENHIDRILTLPFLAEPVIFEKLEQRNLKVVVDAVNSSGSKAIPMLLEKLGCNVIKLYCDESGIFPHTPEPLPENLTGLAEAVKVNNADIGIAVDPDADRLVLIDETGNPIGEENTIVLSVESALEMRHSFHGYSDFNVVVNHSTTRRVEDIADKYGTKVFRSPVGEINVVNKMKEVKALIGGEGSGGVILPACHYGRDSLVGTALILSLIASKNTTLSGLVKQLPYYEMKKSKKQFSGSIDTIINKLIMEFHDGVPLREDGIKINFKDKWVHLRASNTEPIVRVIAEAKSNTEVNELIERSMKYIL
ncbi:MAG: phosphoglucosamine mutase [Ignavibacteriae bacterium]|nr:phosphoglucosamine mutase [Ignavibacteriota bacterium]